MPKTSNNIGNKIIRLTRHRVSIYNIRSTFPCSTRLLIFMAAGFRSTCIVASFSSPGTIQLSRASANTLLDIFVNPRCLLRSFHNLSVDVVGHTTWRLSLRGGRPLFERFMFVNGEGKLSNIHRVHTIYSQRASLRLLQQPVSADCNDRVRWSNTIGKYVFSVLQKMAPVQCSPAMHFCWVWSFNTPAAAPNSIIIIKNRENEGRIDGTCRVHIYILSNSA